ncbi:hypothetical protein [Bacillus sp. C1]
MMNIQIECMDVNCRTFMFGSRLLEGISCVRCGGPTHSKPFSLLKKQIEKDSSKELTIQVNVDTKEANENISELTTSVNKCIAILEKLEEVNTRVGLVLDGKVVASDIAQSINSMKRGCHI